MYNGTAGLWSLITDKTPKGYDVRDLERYKELLHETSAMHQHYDPRNKYPRASRSKKWIHILSPIWNDFQMTGLVSSDEEDDDDEIDDSGEEEEYYNNRSLLDESDGDGIKMYLQKDGRCFGFEKCGRGVKFTPRPRLAGIRGNGLYLRAGSSIYPGEGLLLGPKSPFKKIPILGWLL